MEEGLGEQWEFRFGHVGVEMPCPGLVLSHDCTSYLPCACYPYPCLLAGGPGSLHVPLRGFPGAGPVSCQCWRPA